ncbi:MAG: cytochrome c [Winogradskyella sp.]|uniref:c-type cytochrome n=1 Tax=Winogradskyella sp. TaxID=1883156 RepID=UPI001832C3DA|nr:cytochrome c [Winogradskyella sp.]
MKNILKLLPILCIVLSCNSDKKQEKTASTSQPKELSNDTAVDQKSDQLKASIKEGKFIYNDLCITCHMGNGEGVQRAFPPVADSDYLKNNQEASILAIKNGMSGEIVVNGITYNSAMAPLGLSNEEVADVMNYINHSWGNDYGDLITPQEVAKITE